LPLGAPDPTAPPCIRQRFLPWTAGEGHGRTERVLAPQRGLDSIGPVFRGQLLAIVLELDVWDPPRPTLAYQWHWRQFGIGNDERCSSGFVRPGNPGLVRNMADNRLAPILVCTVRPDSFLLR
jgi:hypothetical protein